MAMRCRYNKYGLLGVSVFISFVFLVITMFVSDHAVPLSSEKMLFRWFETFKQYADDSNKNINCLTDSILLVDTHYAQSLTMEYSDSLPTGKVPVTNRNLLLKYLQSLKEKNDYRFILLDITLDKNVRQSRDTLLYQMIASMPRISIAKPKDIDLADSCLMSKAGRVSYYSVQWETDFVKYPYLPCGERSMPLKMYEELDGRTIKSYGLFCVDKGLARKSVFLTYEYPYGGRDNDYVHYLNDEDLNEVITHGKYILIGDFEDDQHTTYIGDQPGAIIIFNAYLALHNGHHLVKFWMIIIILIAFTFLVYQTLIQSRFTWLFMWIGYPIYLTLLCFIIFYLYGDIYDVLITTSLFYCLKTAVECYRERTLIRQRIGMTKEVIIVISSKIINLFGLFVTFISNNICIITKILYQKISRIWKVGKKTK